MQVRTRPGGIHLGCDKYRIWWQGYSGMGLFDLPSKLKLLKKVWGNTDPKMIILHCGGNDLGKKSIFCLMRKIEEIVAFVKRLFPLTNIIWSHILPRLTWRYSLNNVAMEMARKRINSHAAKLCVSQNGGCIVYNELSLNNIKQSDCLLQADGVHLTDLGCDIYLNQIRAFLDNL